MSNKKSKDVQDVSFGDGKSTKLKVHQTHHGHNMKMAREKDDSQKLGKKSNNNDDRVLQNKVDLAKVNNRLKQIQHKNDTTTIQASQHNRLEGGIAQTEILKIKNTTHRSRVQTNERLARHTALQNISAETFLNPTAQGEFSVDDSRGILSTRHYSQKDLYDQASETVKRKCINFRGLEYGPYQGAYTPNGQYLLLTGEKGHVTLLDWRNGQQLIENNVQEHIFDATFLQDHTLYALAQRKAVCFYDLQGVKVHHIKHDSMQFPRKLTFLPYHFLLVTGTQTGVISWRDVSTGEIIQSSPTTMGPIVSMKSNPSNAVMHVGHNSGKVTLWTPNMPKPVVELNAVYAGQVNDLAVSEDGNYMYTCGSEGTVALWDIRKYQQIAKTALPTPATTCSISSSGILAVGGKGALNTYKTEEFLKEAQRLKSKGIESFKQNPNAVRFDTVPQYLTETFPGGVIQRVSFVPYEDLLAVGSIAGYRHCILPGAGKANFDSFEENPFENRKQRQERVVRGLLEKLQPDMITLDTNVFNVMDTETRNEVGQQKLKSWNDSFKHKVDLETQRKKGRSSTKNVEKRKRLGLVEENKELLEDHLRQRKADHREKQIQEHKAQQSGTQKPKSALDRFL